jgi:hypothetical protein
MAEALSPEEGAGAIVVAGDKAVDVVDPFTDAAE